MMSTETESAGAAVQIRSPYVERVAAIVRDEDVLHIGCGPLLRGGDDLVGVRVDDLGVGDDGTGRTGGAMGSLTLVPVLEEPTLKQATTPTTATTRTTATTGLGNACHSECQDNRKGHPREYLHGNLRTWDTSEWGRHVTNPHRCSSIPS